MDEGLLRFLMLAILVSLVLTIAAISGELSSYRLDDPFESHYPVLELSNVTELLREMPLGRYVSLSGEVSGLKDDFLSESGSTYQQFYLTDGSREVKVFCLQASGSLDLQKGDEVFVTGRLQKYYNEIEVYSQCSGVNIVS